jgi:FlaA1/EpsC-like NDP-sugar epimerase
MSPIQIARRLSETSPRAKMLIMLGGDAVFLPLCMIAAVSLRLGSVADALRTDADMQLMLALLTIPVLGVAGLYRTVVRYIDLRVLLVSGVALAVAVVLVYVLATLMQFLELPRSSVLIYWFVAFAYVVTSRFVARTLLRRGIRSGGRTRVRTAIYGAGEAGAQLAYSMAFSSEYRALCFLDDRRDLQNKTVAGLKVYSPDLLAEVVFRHEIDQIVVAIPSASSAQKRRLIRRVEGAGLPVKILPGLVEMVDGKAGVSDIREVDVADLLGRDAVPPDPNLFARNIAGKVVMVTGAGGSIGSELCRQVLSGVQTVYHAAAYKHVPIVEGNMIEGLRNNVFGTLNVARAAAEAGVETFVLISTDKAVRPTNVMGASKRVAELVLQAAACAQAAAPFLHGALRQRARLFGLGGAAVPQADPRRRAGHRHPPRHDPLLHDHPRGGATRHPGRRDGQGGDVFVLDMGEPVRIADLARSMIRLSGLSERTVDNPGGDIEIQSVGLRPGEKLFEELLIGDDVAPSGHPRIMTAHERHIDPALLDKMLQSLRQACEANDGESMLRQIRNLVPEYRSADEVNAEAAAGLATRA